MEGRAWGLRASRIFVENHRPEHGKEEEARKHSRNPRLKQRVRGQNDSGHTKSSYLT